MVIVGNILLLPHHLFLHAPGVTLALQRQNYTRREGETANLTIVVIGVSEVDVTARVRLDDFTTIREWNNTCHCMVTCGVCNICLFAYDWMPRSFICCRKP